MTERDPISTPALPGGLPFDASQIQFTPAGAGAVARSVQSKERDVVNVFDFMTAAQIADAQARTISFDLATPINNAFASGAREINIGVGTFKIGSQLVTPSGNGARIVQAGNLSSIILKAFNGDAVSLVTGELVWENCCIQGQGATFTGGGINVPTGGGFSSKLLNPRITDTADSCIIFVADSGAGFATEGISVLQPTNNATPAIRNSGVDTGPTTRMFCNLYGGFTAIDFTGMETTQVLGGTANAIVYGDNSKKASVIGMRLTTAGATISIKGTDHLFTGNIVAGNVDLTATASNPTLGPCVFAAGFGFSNSGGVLYAAYNALNGVRITGPASLGATGVQTFSFETPVTRFYIGDGTGYSFAFSKRTGSVTSDLFTISDNGDFKWGKALVALGGGAAPTLGTIGGSGPATAAQNTWMRVLDSTGAAFWVPAWK